MRKIPKYNRYNMPKKQTYKLQTHTRNTTRKKNYKNNTTTRKLQIQKHTTRKNKYRTYTIGRDGLQNQIVCFFCFAGVSTRVLADFVARLLLD